MKADSNNLIYVPLEHIDQRYTVHLDRDIENYLDGEDIKYLKMTQPRLSGRLPKGMFLDAAGTIKTKSHQLFQIAGLYEMGLVTDDTQFFFSDIWFPGIESLAYLNYFYKVKPRITGFLHAGSFTDTDFVRDMERWAKNFEDIVFDIADEIFVASDFIKQDVIKKRIVDPNKITVTELPLDSRLCEHYKPPTMERDNLVLFNGRICDEKQPWMFDQLQRELQQRGWADATFIKTQEQGYNKSEYYELLSKAKVVVSYALQENFGYGIAEAVQLGCIPVVPNKLVYPELYPEQYRYNNFEESVDKVAKALDGELTVHRPILKTNREIFNAWFK
tara:strand:+ start:76 stop:1071 length:996 start_codon:yes stop_codon:yes gene_type:complete